MSKRAPRRGRTRRDAGTHAADGGAGLYVYCVGRRAELAPLLAAATPEAIEADAPLELVEEGELAAVVSRVPLSEYGEEAFERRLSEPAWVAPRAMRHELVVEHFAAAATVAPVRFGAIYLSRESARVMLAGKAAKILQTLRHVEGREEWGLNVYVTRERLREAVADFSPRLRELAAQADALSPGRAYMLRKQIDSLRDAEAAAIRREARTEAGMVGSELAALSGSKPLRPGEKTEEGEVVARAFFLIDRGKRKTLHARAEKLAAKYAPLGFRVELVGPWPAYHAAELGGPIAEPGAAAGPAAHE